MGSLSTRAAVASLLISALVFMAVALVFNLMSFAALRELRVSTSDGAALVYDAATVAAAWLTLLVLLRKPRSHAVATAIAFAPALAVVALEGATQGAGALRALIDVALLLALGYSALIRRVTG